MSFKRKIYKGLLNELTNTEEALESWGHKVEEKRLELGMAEEMVMSCKEKIFDLRETLNVIEKAFKEDLKEEDSAE